jgi:putative transposase
MPNLSTFADAFHTLELGAKLPLLLNVLQSFLCLSHSAGIRPLSRYSDYSERTLFRLIATELPWTAFNLCMFYHHVYKKVDSPNKLFALIADEVVEQKAGKATYGLRKFFSSTRKKAISGVNFFGFSIVNLCTGETSPLDLKQVIYTEEDEKRLKEGKEAQKTKREKKKVEGTPSSRGRAKGTPNKPKTDPTTTNPVFRTFKAGLIAIMTQIATQQFPLIFPYMLVDSAYTAAHYLQLLQDYKMYIISKLPKNVALYYPYKGENGKTKPKKYGDKVVFDALDDTKCQLTKTEDGIQYQYFQYQAWRKSCADFKLNVLTIRATHPDGKIGYSHLFTTDLALTAEKIAQYYAYRFQIEFDFRDVKQLFGLSKIKNYHPVQLDNMFRMSFSALAFAKILQQQWALKLIAPDLSLIDLKSIAKAQFYLKNAINNAQNDIQYFFSPQFLSNFVPDDLINKA